MPKKKEPKIPPFVKFIFIGAAIIGIGFLIIQKTAKLMTKVDYFKVRSITIDPSLQFINKNDLKGLMGKNIFVIDLKSVQGKLNRKYPQASQLKVIKRYPNQISVLAKQRLPFAQIAIQGKNVILDKEGVVLSWSPEPDHKLTTIIGAKVASPRLVMGLPLRGSELWQCLKIIKLFEASESLDDYSIVGVNAENMSKIVLTLSNKLDILIDRDNIAQKIRVLGVVLAQDAFNLKETRYVDLRFKEPIIGKK